MVLEGGRLRILVTGGAGFIGSHIVDRYIAEKHTVCVVDNLSKGRRKNVNPKAEFYEVDICNRIALEDVFEKERPEVVNHHAAQVDVRFSVRDPVFDAQTNIVGSLNILELAVRYGARRIIYASSGGAVYGEPKVLPAVEESLINPMSPYGASKHAVEHYINLYGLNYGLEYVILRYGNVFGPRQDPFGEAGVVAIFANLILKGESPTVFGDGEQTRDFVFVGDVADANLLALTKGTGQVLNIGSGKETSVNRIFSELAAIIGFEGKPRYESSRVGEVKRIFLDISRAKSVLGWLPRTSISDGLRETVRCIREEIRD
jgi:UDP-glucose 4-epimerase